MKFGFVEHWVLFLVVNFLILGRQSCSDPLEVVAKVDIFALLSQIDLPVDSFEVESEWLLLLSLQNLQYLSLIVNLFIRYFNENEDFFFGLMLNHFELCLFDGVHVFVKICFHLFFVPFLKDHDEIPIFKNLFGFTRESFLYPWFVFLPKRFLLLATHHTFIIFVRILYISISNSTHQNLIVCSENKSIHVKESYCSTECYHYLMTSSLISW